MASEAAQKIDKAVLWEGGRSPFSLTYGKTMMWFFLVSDAPTFGGLLMALGFARYKYADAGTWPIGEEVFQSLPDIWQVQYFVFPIVL